MVPLPWEVERLLPDVVPSKELAPEISDLDDPRVAELPVIFTVFVVMTSSAELGGRGRGLAGPVDGRLDGGGATI
jgi:hypothetical protein